MDCMIKPYKILTFESVVNNFIVYSLLLVALIRCKSVLFLETKIETRHKSGISTTEEIVQKSHVVTSGLKQVIPQIVSW